MFLEDKQLDKRVPIPLYFQLKEMIIEEIKSEKYPIDTLIPTEMELSEQFGISRTTVRQAITELVQEGWLYRVKSKGTFIARNKMKQDFLQRLETYAEQMKRIGVKPSTELLEIKVEVASKDVADNLQIAEGEKVIFLFRRRYGDDRPVVMAVTYIPYEKCSFVLDYDMEKNSLYDILASHEDTKIYSARRLVEAVEATARDAKDLDVRKGSPIQMFHTVGYNKDGVPLEYSISRYRGDMSSFQLYVYVDPEK